MEKFDLTERIFKFLSDMIDLVELSHNSKAVSLAFLTPLDAGHQIIYSNITILISEPCKT